MNPPYIAYFLSHCRSSRHHIAYLSDAVFLQYAPPYTSPKGAADYSPATV